MTNKLLQEKLLLLVAESRARGIPVDPKVLEMLQRQDGVLKWNVDANGYFINRSGRLYNPAKAHYDFIASEARFCAIFGGRGSGKTTSAVQKTLNKIKQGESGVVINPIFENFKTSTWVELKNWIDWNMVVPAHRYRRSDAWQPEKPFSLAFVNGAKLLCKGLKNPDGARGPNLNFLWYDEGGSDPDGLAWTIAIASIRVGKNPQAWVSTTPAGKAHWLYRFFVTREGMDFDMIEEVEKTGQQFSFYNFVSIEDNKANLDPAYYASILASYPEGYLRDQEVNGLFVSPEGNLANPDWLVEVTECPYNEYSKLRYWDLAATEKKFGKKNDPDRAVGTLFSWNGEKAKDAARFCIHHQHYGQWEWEELLEQIIQTALEDGELVPIHIEQEPGSGGKNQVAAIASAFKKDERTKYKDFRVIAHNPREYGDKIMRANYWLAEAKLGQIYYIAGEWKKQLFAEMSDFPAVPHDDCIDSVSGARLCILPIARWKSPKFLSL